MNNFQAKFDKNPGKVHLVIDFPRIDTIVSDTLDDIQGNFNVSEQIEYIVMANSMLKQDLVIKLENEKN